MLVLALAVHPYPEVQLDASYLRGSRMLEFRDRCNREWLIERLCYQLPLQTREHFLMLQTAARLC